jgi:hypothetical protein
MEIEEPKLEDAARISVVDFIPKSALKNMKYVPSG